MDYGAQENMQHCEAMKTDVSSESMFLLPFTLVMERVNPVNNSDINGDVFMLL